MHARIRNCVDCCFHRRQKISLFETAKNSNYRCAPIESTNCAGAIAIFVSGTEFVCFPFSFSLSIRFIRFQRVCTLRFRLIHERRAQKIEKYLVLVLLLLFLSSLLLAIQALRRYKIKENYTHTRNGQRPTRKERYRKKCVMMQECSRNWAVQSIVSDTPVNLCWPSACELIEQMI